jgi:HSP20 family molecular chaperone IbpA
MAREGSEAGNYYNQNTILFLRKQIKSYIKDQRFDVIKSFRQHLSISSGTYMEKPIEINNVEYDEEKKKIVIKSNDKIKLKKYYEDELGISNFYGNIIEPYYNYDIYDDKIKINIELPGIIIKFHAKLILLNGNYVLIYFGNYKIREEIKDMELLYNNIQYGEFRLQINIPITIGIIKDSIPKHIKNKKNGEITLIYYLNKKEDNEVMMDL